MGKKRGKLILMPPFAVDWPKVDKETEDRIITALCLKLQEFPSLESKRTKEDRKKSGQSDAISHPQLTQEEEEKLKARLRQQLVIGHRQVTKVLELDQMALVLVSGDTQPPILLRSLLPVVASRRCPAVCVSSLSPRVTDTVGVTSMLALGIKKSQPGEPNDFEEFVTTAAALAPPLSVPWASQGAEVSRGMDGGGGMKESALSWGDTVEKKGSAVDTPPPAKKWSLMEPEKEKEVMEKLLELVKPYEALFQKPRSKYTSEETQTRKTINSCMTMDLAAIRSATFSETLELLLVQNESSAPYHPLLVSAVDTAIGKGCPVLHMASLKRELSGVVRESCLRAVGFKKSQAGPTKQPEAFHQFVAMVSKHDPAYSPPPSSSQSKDGSSGKEIDAGPSIEKKRKQRPASPVYDVSSLYVYKKEEDKNMPDSKTESQKASETASETYISLSSEPTIQYLGGKSPSEGAAVGDIGFVDSTGVRKKNLAAEKTAEPKGVDSPKETGGGFSGVMGLDSVDAAMLAKPLYHKSRGKKPKANLKRALDQSADRGEFVSFKVRPTSVRVSVPNPNKKKHKKFKKK